MKIGRSGYQNIDLSAFTGETTTIPGIYAKVTSGLPLKINNLIEVGDLFTYALISGGVAVIPIITLDSGSLVIAKLSVYSNDTVSLES